MKIIRDSIGFIVAAMLIVGLLGLAGWAGWNVYAGHKAVEELAVHPQAEPPVAAVPTPEDTAYFIGDPPSPVCVPTEVVPSAASAFRVATPGSAA